MNSQVDAYFSVQNSEHNHDVTTPDGSPQSPLRAISPVFDVDNFLYHSEPLYPTHFERILDSPQLYQDTALESHDYGPISVSLPHAAQERSAYPRQNLGKACRDPIPFIFQTDKHPHHVRSIAPYSFTKMTPNTSSTPSSTNTTICRSHSAELSQLEMFHSPIQPDQAFYPGSDYTPQDHVCPHRVNTHSTPICCNYKYESPVDSYECPYPPAVNKRCVPQQCVTGTPNYAKPSVDQFNTPAISKKDMHPPNASVSTPASQCYKNCVCGYHYIEEGVCDVTPISSQGQYDSCLSTQEGNSYDIFPSESTASQDTVLADSSQQSMQIFESCFVELPSTKQEKYSQKRKEEKKRNSERERMRIRQINKAFSELGDLCSLHFRERAHTKVATIQQALDLIQRLQSDIASHRASINDCQL